MTELPTGWVSAVLGDVSSGFQAGRNLKASPVPAGAGELGVLKISAVTWGRFRPNENKALLRGDSPLPHEIVRGGDLLLSRANTTELVGAPVLVESDHPHLMLPDKILRILYEKRAVEPRFLLYALRSQLARAYMEKNATGTSDSMRNLSQPKLREVPISLAPLPEQKRIADKLDALLARVYACRERLDRVPGILKRFRQAVLAAATCGELTREWREARGYETGWRQVSLGSLLTDLRYGTARKCAHEPTKTPVLRIPNVVSGSINLDDLKHADFDEVERSKLALLSGDILMIRSNGSLGLVGRTALVTAREAGFLYAGYLIRLRVDLSRALPAYLSIVLAGPKSRSRIEATARSTTGVNNINAEEIRAFPVEVPSLDEQAEVVRRVGELFELVGSLERRLSLAQSRIERAVPAILAKAFRGELVPQDPNDEPAADLLARIRSRPSDDGHAEPKRIATRGPRKSAKAQSNAPSDSSPQAPRLPRSA